ncbi:binary toxin-like calcium binding domain-containing protein [Brevibacillus laterosporus]|uniref:binary toxin-like calcium binding domain-containing protein n=1 Tax=Brevibacillus laterosporus TaxID=1465 RepID=UPI0018CFACDF|nr:binary toxin-like calcium binding domain-containing protein [Brevibacillus laterosporus]MBG9789833.1 hypothetical protein [Brevibacillus laterosporus]
MKKGLSSVVIGTLFASMFLNGNVNAVYANSKTNQIATTTQASKDNQIDREGLLGYYFKGKDFNDLTLFAPTRDNTLIYDQQTANTLVDQKHQEYHSIRWIGLIQSSATGDFTFKLSDDENAIIELDGKVISEKGNNKQSVHLEKGQLVQIKIEYQSDDALHIDNKIFKELKLFKIDSQNHSQQVQQDELRNPEFNKKETQVFLKKASKTNLFTQKTKRDIDEDTDTDGDSIPDVWEENGYTIQNKVAVKWDDSLASKGYQKFTSNPLEAHTVGDPYSDYEKAARDMPLSNAKETFNPLVAAFPSVNVSLEKVILSKNEDLSHSVESSQSTNWSYTNTEGVNVNAGWSGLGPSFGVSVNYQHSETVANEWGSATNDGTHINGAESAYLNANVRYNNVGTGAIYETKPTTSFILDGTTIGTIKAKENTTALTILPDQSYPEKGKNGIAINTMDDFNSRPIPLNKEQLNTYLSNKKPILLETDQVEGKYAVKDTNGNITIAGDWNGITDEISAKTASIIVDNGNQMSEKRVAAKDYTNPEDKTPNLSVKEALKLAYPDEIEEKDGLLFYNDQPIFEASVQSYVDEYTAKQIRKQLNDSTGSFKDVKNLYDVKLEPKMNFTIKTSTLYDGGESDNTKIGNWYYTYVVNGGNTGKKQYRSANKGAFTELSTESKNKLKKNIDYYVSLYMKADSKVSVDIEIDGQQESIVTDNITLDHVGYQRINILVPNLEGNEINTISIKGDGQTNVYWDDVSFVEVGAEEIEYKDPVPQFDIIEGDFDFFGDPLAVKYHDATYFIDSPLITQTPGTFSFTYKVIGEQTKTVLDSGSGKNANRINLDFKNVKSDRSFLYTLSCKDDLWGSTRTAVVRIFAVD